jgi:SAM-dependent methyltransferase
MQPVKISKDFKPNITYPLYFMRKGLYDGIFTHRNLMYGKLMDFGSGRKPYKDLFRKVTEYVGVDYEGEGHSHHNESVDVFYDGRKIPFEDDTFDSVFSSEVFEHIFNLEEILPEIKRVMKPGAHLLATCPFVWNLHEIPVDYARYTGFALKHLFEKNGFEVVEIEKKGNYITTITQMRVLYFNAYLFPKLVLINRIPYSSAFFTSIMNIIGVLKNKIFPKREDWYQSNIIVAKKK